MQSIILKRMCLSAIDTFINNYLYLEIIMQYFYTYKMWFSSYGSTTILMIVENFIITGFTIFGVHFFWVYVFFVSFCIVFRHKGSRRWQISGQWYAQFVLENNANIIRQY